jgi:hypothetical protein
VAILKEADAGRPAKEIWRQYGISLATYYKWKAKYAGIDSPAFTGGVLSEFKLRLSRVFLPLASHVPPDNLFGNPNREHKVPG